MKRLTIIALLIIAIVVGGCSQTGNQSAVDTTGGPSGTQSGSTRDGADEETIDYPTREIEWVLPFNPGGTSDSSARAIASVVTKYLPNNPNVVIVHMPGANATLGVEAVYNAKPDGYTIGTTISGAMALHPQLGTTNYDPKELKPIIKYLTIPRFVMVRADSPWKTFDDWLDYVKNHPGKFKLADAGGGEDFASLAIRKLMDDAGIELNLIPYNGGGPATAALLGNHVDGLLSNPSNVDPEDVRILFTLAKDRSKIYTEVPTLNELGYDIYTNDFYGLLAPPDTPDQIIQILHDAFKQALEDPEAIDQLEKLGLEIDYESSEEFKNLLEEEYERAKILLKYR